MAEKKRARCHLQAGCGNGDQSTAGMNVMLMTEQTIPLAVGPKRLEMLRTSCIKGTKYVSASCCRFAVMSYLPAYIPFYEAGSRSCLAAVGDLRPFAEAFGLRAFLHRTTTACHVNSSYRYCW